MGKQYSFSIYPKDIKYNNSIRDKFDIIDLLFNIVSFISRDDLNKYLDQSTNKEKIELVLNIDKMSRIFICEAEKIHTFQFPFNITNSDDGESTNLEIFYQSIKLTSGIMAIFKATFHNISEHESFETIMENYWNIIDDFNINKIESKLYVSIITFLLTFEPGYLRFDYDQERQSEKNHPVNHLDFYYTNKNTFKIGLNEKIENSTLIDLLNINTECRFLK